MRSSGQAILLRIGRVTTPLGDMLLAIDGDGVLRAADFADCEVRLRRLLDRRLGFNHNFVAGEAPEAIKASFEAYFEGDLGALLDIPLRSNGTTFQESVWNALRAIEPGRPVTYAQLAGRLHRPQSARAVGHANGANPACIVIPCHRLVGADGNLTGYSGGVARKRWLLDHEARYAG